MSLFNKVIWSEGMFLRPQHFQQQDRYIESLLRQNASALRPFGWGLKEIKVDQDLLKTGKFALTSCSGVMPDGTQFELPDEADAPLVLELDETIENAVIYLALPVHHARGLDIDFNGGGDPTRRFRVQELDAADSSGVSDQPAELQVGRLQLRLMLESEERSGYHCVALARVIQVGADKNVVFDEDFIVPALDCRAAPKLSGFLGELVGLLHQRGDSIAGRVTESGRGGAAEIADFLLLLAVNRYEPLIAHLTRVPDLHPEALYRLLVQMAGEFATFATKEKRTPAFPEYRHDDLKSTYLPVLASLRQSLSMVFERSAVSIPLEERKFGIRVGTVSDRKLLTESMFVLAVNADVPADGLRRTFPAQIKIGPVEKIRDLVNRALPGISIEALPVAPRQIPFHAGVTYFSLDTRSPFWKELDRSGGLAVHVAGKYPGLEMALWAIRR